MSYKILLVDDEKDILEIPYFSLSSISSLFTVSVDNPVSNCFEFNGFYK